MKKLAKFMARLLMLLFLALVAAVLYLDINGFPPALKELVEKQFLRVGYAVKFGTLQLDVLRGVIATEAVVADAQASKQILARIDEVQLQWNWRWLLHREEVPIQALRIANATISVPTPADEIGPELFTASEAYATFRFLGDRTTEINQLSGVYCGIRVQVSGRIRPRTTAIAETEKKPAGERSPFVFVTKSLRELNSLKVTQPPQLDVNLDLNLAQPFDSRVHAKLVGSNFEYRKLPVEKASVDVAMREGATEIMECQLNVEGGELAIHGKYDIAMGRFDLQMRSTLDPTLVAETISDDLKHAVQDVRFEERPTIAARYVLSPETGSLPLLTGTVQTGGLVVRGVPFHAIGFAFENQGPEIKVTNAKIVTAEGQLTGRGQFHIESSDFSYELDSTLDPRKLLPLMTPVMKHIVEPSWFETPPHIVASVTGDFVDPDAFAYDAELTAERCNYRGVALASVAATMKLRHSRLDVPALILRRDEGELRGTLLADFNNHQITFDVTTTANPGEMAPLLGPKAAEVIRPYHFGPRTEASARGLVDLDVPGNSAWSAQVINDGFAYWKVSADRASATVTVTNNVLAIDNFDADFYDGKLRGRAEFALTNAPIYQFDFTTDRVDVRKLMTKVWGRDSKSSGWLTGQCALRGLGSDLGTLRGQGTGRVTDGVLGELGLFGIFSKILNQIAPGLGSAKLTSGTASFKVENNAIKTDNMEIQAGAYTLTSQGKIGFDCKLDFHVQGQFLRAVPGINILTWFFKNLFEYKIGGSCSTPTYRPTNLPKELMPHGSVGEKTPENPPEK